MAATGAKPATLAPAGVLLCLALHPFSPLTVCSDLAGNLHIVDLLGLEYDPIIVTATLKKNWFKKKHLMRCPACQQEHPIKQE